MFDLFVFFCFMHANCMERGSGTSLFWHPWASEGKRGTFIVQLEKPLHVFTQKFEPSATKNKNVIGLNQFWCSSKADRGMVKVLNPKASLRSIPRWAFARHCLHKRYTLNFTPKVGFCSPVLPRSAYVRHNFNVARATLDKGAQLGNSPEEFPEAKMDAEQLFQSRFGSSFPPPAILIRKKYCL